MKKKRKKMMFLRIMFLNLLPLGILFSQVITVPLNRFFEREISNQTNYKNCFTDVTLTVQYQAPSGKLYHFSDFYDGDGCGNAPGNIWKIRFMPNEPGKWTYVYSWSDGMKGGKGELSCIAKGAGKGILQL